MSDHKPADNVNIRLATEDELNRLLTHSEAHGDWIREFDEAALEHSQHQLKIDWGASKDAAYLYPIDTAQLAKVIRKSREIDVPTLGYLDWIMRPTDAGDARANLEEAFEQWVGRHGETSARRILKWQGFRLAAGYILDRAVDRLGQFVKLLRFGY